MSKPKTAIPSAVASLLVLSMAGAADTAGAAAKEVEMVKCYGIVKAGLNDCQTATGSCAGTSKVDAQGDAWVYIPKGTCDKIVGASREPQAEDDITKVKTGS